MEYKKTLTVVWQIQRGKTKEKKKKNKKKVINCRKKEF